MAAAKRDPEIEESEPKGESGDLQPNEEGVYVIPDEEEASASEDDDDEPKEPRKKRRRNRMEERIRQEREETERRVRAEYDARLREIESRVPRQQQADPTETRLKAIRDEEISLFEQVNAVSPENRLKIRDKLYELGEERSAIISRREVHRAMTYAQANQRPPHLVALESQFTDVLNSPQALTWAQGQERIEMAEKNRQLRPEEQEAILRRARKRFMGPDDDDDRRDEFEVRGRSRYEGARRGGGTGEGPPRKELTKFEMDLAVARWPHLSKVEAARKFHKEVKSQPD